MAWPRQNDLRKLDVRRIELSNQKLDVFEIAQGSGQKYEADGWAEMDEVFTSLHKRQMGQEKKSCSVNQWGMSRRAPNSMLSVLSFPRLWQWLREIKPQLEPCSWDALKISLPADPLLCSASLLCFGDSSGECENSRNWIYGTFRVPCIKVRRTSDVLYMLLSQYQTFQPVVSRFLHLLATSYAIFLEILFKYIKISWFQRRF